MIDRDAIRPDAAAPVITKANIAPAFLCQHPCGHGLEVWLIGTKLQAWHRGAQSDDGPALLTECDAPPATAKRPRR